MAEARQIVPIKNLAQDPYRNLVAYPDPAADAVEARIRQLGELGITGLEFNGSLRVGKLSVLGKGVVGLVFSGIAERTRVAVKIRRVDSRRNSMKHEAEMIKAANNAGVGPRFLGVSQDVLEMQYVEGKPLPLWISTLRGRGTRTRIRSTFKKLFDQCVRLDSYGIDHGELSRAHKNVLVGLDDQPWILDFESASLMRRVNNFTSIAQYLFLSNRFAKRVIRILGPVDTQELVNYLRLYKSGKTNDAYQSVLNLLGFPS